MNQFIQYRREFHKYPETGWREIRTSARIAEILIEMGYEVLMGSEVLDYDNVLDFLKPSAKEMAEIKQSAVDQGANPVFVEKTCGIPGVIAEFDTGSAGPVTALRFDIDALPYDEPHKEDYRPYGEDFCSVNPGAVHACGHDAHTAVGLGIAEALLEQKDQLKGKIRLIFQPAEETFGGAQSIVDKGHLDDADYFLSLHVALAADGVPMKSHAMASGCKDFLSVRQLDVTFHGVPAHPCGSSQDGKNALLAACTAAINLHAIAPHGEGMHRVNVGKIEAGIAPNTIAPNALMVVEYRGVTKNISEYMGRRVMDVIEGAARMYDMEYSIVDYGEVPSAKSDDALMERIQSIAKEIPWFDTIHYEGGVEGADDASVMMTRVQERGGLASYIGIGTTTTGPVHNPEFDIDEDCIPAAIQLFIKILEDIHR